MLLGVLLKLLYRVSYYCSFRCNLGVPEDLHTVTYFKMFLHEVVEVSICYESECARFSVQKLMILDRADMYCSCHKCEDGAWFVA